MRNQLKQPENPYKPGFGVNTNSSCINMQKFKEAYPFFFRYSLYNNPLSSRQIKKRVAFTAFIIDLS